MNSSVCCGSRLHSVIKAPFMSKWPFKSIAPLLLKIYDTRQVSKSLDKDLGLEDRICTRGSPRVAPTGDTGGSAAAPPAAQAIALPTPRRCLRGWPEIWQPRGGWWRGIFAGMGRLILTSSRATAVAGDS